MKLYVVTAFKNRPDLLEPCLETIAAQTDPDFEVLVGDDASDEPGVGEVLDEFEGRQGWHIFRHPERLGVVGNQASMIRDTPMNPEDVVAFLDGDDRFAHPEVISRLMDVYASTNVDVTYGNYAPDPPDPGCPPVKPIPPEVCAKRGAYRRWVRANGTCWNHLRTMRRRIFDAIPESYMKIDGQWLDGGADFALMTPGLELAGGRHHMFEEVLVLYTSDRPDAEWRSLSEGIARGRKYTNTRPPLRSIPPLKEIP